MPVWKLPRWFEADDEPLPARPETLLAAFISRFLVPAGADGAITSLEEFPLAAAYHALRIREVEAILGADEIARRCREAMAAPAAAPTPHDVDATFDLLLRCSDRTSAQEWSSMVEWLARQTMGCRPPSVERLPHRPLPPRSLRGALALVDRLAWRGAAETAVAHAPAAATETAVAPAGAPAPATPTPAPAASPALAEPDPPVCVASADAAACERVVSGALAESLRARAEEIAGAVRVRLADPWRPWLAFDRARASLEQRALLVDEVPAALWYFGDLHGDLLALECALAHVAARDPDATLVFLGDLVDDGPLAFEVVLRVLGLALEAPERVVLLPGNHDEALRFDPESESFRSSVMPSDFAEWLSAHADVPGVAAVAEAFIAVEASLPRALFLADGLLVAHGGIPQKDLWGEGRLTSRVDLDAPLAQQDFVWTRAHPRAKRRMPDRHTRGAEFGIEDFDGFCERASEVLARPVARMVRGHDHVAERYSLNPNHRRHRMLTINTLSCRLPRELTGPFERVPCIARHRPGALPEVHRIEVPAAVVRAVHGEPEEERETPPHAEA